MLKKLNKKQAKIIKLIFCAISLIYLLFIVIFGSMMYDSKTHSVESHADRMDASVTDVEYPEGEYIDVSVGMYVEALRNISIADSSFETVFYVWFSWEGDKAFSPGDSFQIVGGSIEDKELVSEHYDGNENYQRYKVTAVLDKYYNLTRVSLESHMLNIYIEDTTRDGAKLRYVPDTENTNMSSRVSIPGFEVDGSIQTVSKPHEYKSTYDSPNANGEYRVFSQYIAGIEIVRSDLGFFLKVLIPFVLSVGLALLALFSHKTDSDSLGLSGAAFFGVVANAYVVQSIVPSNGGTFGILDMLNIISLFTVILVVLISIVSLNLRNKDEDSNFCRAIDIASFISISVGYILFIIIVPLLASSI